MDGLDVSITPDKALRLVKAQRWMYETDEMQGVCELAGDVMTVCCRFFATTNTFYDVHQIDAVIRARLLHPVSVERLVEQLSADFPDLRVQVKGRAATHGWITSEKTERWGDA
jgi:hypothetical protein